MQRVFGFVAVLCLYVTSVCAEERYETWEPLQSTFESTGGGGIMIKEYRPVIIGDRCITDFTATEPGGKVHHNTIEFETVAVQGGTLCVNGKWRSKDGTMMGTTPLRVFIKDGVARRSP